MGGCEHHKGSDNCACKTWGRSTSKELTGLIIMVLVVPIVFAVLLPFVYSYNIYSAVGGDVSLNGIAYTRDLATALFFWSMAIIFGAIPLAVLICRRNDCLGDEHSIRCWYRVVASTFFYLLLTLGWGFAFFTLNSCLVAGLFSIAAVLVAISHAYSGYWRLRSKWPAALFTVSVLINIGLAVYALSAW